MTCGVKMHRRVTQCNTILSSTGKRPYQGQIWRFLLELLSNQEYNPKYITWEDRDKGVFRFVCGDSIARLWAQKRGRTSMPYDFLARAIR